MSVDLPAPFSPTIAWILPRRTVRLTLELATTPGNRLVMALSSTAGGSVSITAPSQHANNGGEPRAPRRRWEDQAVGLVGTVILPSTICAL